MIWTSTTQRNANSCLNCFPRFCDEISRQKEFEWGSSFWIGVWRDQPTIVWKTGLEQKGHGDRSRRQVGHIVAAYGKPKMNRKWGLSLANCDPLPQIDFISQRFYSPSQNFVIWGIIVYTHESAFYPQASITLKVFAVWRFVDLKYSIL